MRYSRSTYRVVISHTHGNGLPTHLDSYDVRSDSPSSAVDQVLRYWHRYPCRNPQSLYESVRSAYKLRNQRVWLRKDRVQPLGWRYEQEWKDWR